MPRSECSWWDRIWEKVQESPTGCWLWSGWSDRDGYGFTWVGGTKGKNVRLHRLTYRMFRGEIPSWLQPDHLCSNTGCINPAHLELVTPRENILRSNSIAARNIQKTHCDHGHPFDEKNTYYYKGWRSCRQCHRAREIIRRRKAAKLEV